MPPARSTRNADSAPAAFTGLHLVGTGHPRCGIGDFGAQLRAALASRDFPARSECDATLTLQPGPVPMTAIWRAVSGADAVVANVPLVAWKRVLAAPLVAFAMAALRGRRRVAILHEWASLHRLRRLVLRPLLVLSDTIAFPSPQVAAELAADPVVGWLARRGTLIPLPPNIARPAEIAQSALRARLLAARAAGRFVLGHFGSIYPGKQPEAILDVAAALVALGADPLLVFVGSFIRAFDGIEATFRARVAALGLEDRVIVSGYVAAPDELFGVFATIDAFVYVLPDGLTARRASILASVQSGRPVVVTAPLRADEFDHHPRFRALLGNGAIVLAPPQAGPAAYADLILAAARRPTAPSDLDAEAWLADAAGALRDILHAAPPAQRPAAAR